MSTEQGNEWTGETNWEAYTHEELHAMLWDEADVADVSGVAEEWRRHSAALTDHAAALREQQAALASGWEGEAADAAVTRLGDLAGHVDDIAAHAATAHRAAQDAADALARARTMMPPPPAAAPAVADPAAWFAPVPAPAPGFWFGTPPVSSAQSPSFYLTFGAPPATSTASAFDAMATGGSSMYFTTYGADQARQQAVYTMRVYESSLHDGNGLTATYAARSAGSGGPVTSAPGWQAGGRTAGGTPQPGGVPWERLVSPAPLRPGPAVGAVTTGGGMPLPQAQLVAEPAAGRAAGHGGMVPPVAGRGTATEDDERHENRMPTIDQGLFAVDLHTSAAVIGAES